MFRQFDEDIVHRNNRYKLYDAVMTASSIDPMSSQRLVPAISINRASPVLRLSVFMVLLFS